MFWTQDLFSIVNDTAGFSETAYINGIAVKCIMDNEYTGVNINSGEVETAAPQIHVQSSDCERLNIKHRDTVVIRQTTYKIMGLQPDGSGLTVVVLSKD